ncbi:MAG: glycerol kinase GlpK [Armatimonadota bacterium]|nr:glycerol kinase GlpK [Armatimonadota bacterium]MDR7529124.1 glycerol kinase GlpK [Armatimonadota bacterium]
MGRYVVAVDQGTTGTRCAVVDETGRVRALAYREHRQIYPQPGWVEHDPQEIWARTCEVIGQALRDGAIRPQEVAAVGVTNQRETIVAWDRRTGEPAANAIVWQDTRTRDICQRIIDEGWEPYIRQRTGLVSATYFSGPKLRWVLDHVPQARRRAERGELLCGTIDTWLIWWLTGGPRGGVHVTDVTNASRTMLMDLQALQWDERLLAYLDVPPACLPQIRPSSDAAAYGFTPEDGPLGARVPVCAAAGDQQAALVGQVCFQRGETKNTYGTGNFLLMNTGGRAVASAHGLLTTAAYSLAPGSATYALEGSIAVTGAAVQWLRDNLRLIAHAAETEALARDVDDTGGVYFVPAFSGLFAPHWDMYARGVIVGLTRFTDRRHLVRATLEAICFQTREVVEAMRQDAGMALEVLKVDGGATANDFLMQLQADILGIPVVRPTVRETTALGAAYLAGLAAGLWARPEDVRAHWQVDRTFEPRWSADRREAAYRGWRRAVERARGWVEPAETG